MKESDKMKNSEVIKLVNLNIHSNMSFEDKMKTNIKIDLVEQVKLGVKINLNRVFFEVDNLDEDDMNMRVSELSDMCKYIKGLGRNG